MVRKVWIAYIATISVFIVAQVVYLSQTRSLDAQALMKKEHISAWVGLPDLALVSEAHYVRHRSMSDLFSYFNESPELLEYFPSTFVYRPNGLEPSSRIEYAR